MELKEVESPAEADEIFAEAVGLEVFSYNDQVTHEVFSVFRLLSLKEEGGALCTGEIADRLNMLPSHVELIQYILCNKDHAEYGTSPRCCWLTKKGRALYQRIAEAWDTEDKPAE